ncbi:DUF262 domain-containing protein [Staphylococcus massiliensis]|uniref:DUF262 domain-containing protein n=2 Tax=Staphylococcus massiliensis TaxID=555791 RepID=UPI001EDC9EB4|nr:DUF262 domain-containing protein [Staphylococcus massiliensis]MCG3402123.1 DUF262 domain-containing protein [Staphylococcus massiliensis]
MNYKYNIPIYQRNYSWREENIETMVKDINEQPKGYYLGNVIITEEGNYSFDVVDGQQRLTTINLIFLAIYDNLSAILEVANLSANDNIAHKISSCRVHTYDKIYSKNSGSPMHLLSPDKEILADIQKRVFKNDQLAKPHKNKVFGKRYDFVKNLIKTNFLGETELSNLNRKDLLEGVEKLIEFYDKLNHAEILLITVPNLNEGFTVFTSFNAKGLPLTLLDLFKSFYLKEADGQISQEESVSKWEELISIFHNDNEEPITNVVTQFLLNNYDTFESQKNGSITQNTALKLYERIFHDEGYEYIDNLIKKAKVFSNMNGKIETIDILNLDDDIQQKLFDLDKLESTQAYPIIFFLLNKLLYKKITTSLISNFLDFLITYYVRRNIILKPKASNIRAKAIQSVRLLREKDNIDLKDIKEIKKIFKSIAATDEEFKVALDGSIYITSKNTTRLILTTLERKHGNFFNKQNPENLNSINDKG